MWNKIKQNKKIAIGIGLGSILIIFLMISFWPTQNRRITKQLYKLYGTEMVSKVQLYDTQLGKNVKQVSCIVHGKLEDNDLFLIFDNSGHMKLVKKPEADLLDNGTFDASQITKVEEEGKYYLNHSFYEK